MRKVFLALGLVTGLISIGAFAHQSSGTDFPDLDFSADLKVQVSPKRQILALQAEGVGYHTLFIGNGLVPDEGCDQTDRAIIVGAADEGEALFEAALMAKVRTRPVQLVVEGCAVLRPGSMTTAPQVVRLLVF